MPAASRSPILIRLTLAAVCLLLLWAYVDAAARQGHRLNTTLENTDQAAYLEYAVNIHENGASHIGNRNQMPLYPFLQALVYDSPATIDEAFERGKTFNLALSVMLLVLLGVLWQRTFPTLQTAALLLVTAFTVFVFRAAYIQVELLYYVLALVTFLLLCRMLEEPSWRLALLAGLSVAVTHLAKAAVLPALALFLALAVVRASLGAWRAWRGDEGARRPAARLVSREVGMALTVAATFLVAVSPYLITSQRVFGDAFYNVNSTFYFWYDTWADARSGSVRGGDQFGWPALPPEALPSARDYLSAHGPRQIAQRLVAGLRVVFGEAVHTYGYFKYLVFYSLAALAALVTQPRWALRELREHSFVVAFTLAYLGGYTLLYAWYVPIASGNRLVLALFLPTMYVAARILHELAKPTSSQSGPRVTWFFRFVHAVLIAGVALELYDILAHRVETVYGGL